MPQCIRCSKEITDIIKSEYLCTQCILDTLYPSNIPQMVICKKCNRVFNRNDSMISLDILINNEKYDICDNCKLFIIKYLKKGGDNNEF